MTVYISGQITNNNNAEKQFSNAEEYLRDKGFTPINPIKLCYDMPTETSWVNKMIRCITNLQFYDAIYMLDNWHNSAGASIEFAFAKKLGIKIFYQRSL